MVDALSGFRLGCRQMDMPQGIAARGITEVRSIQIRGER
jgi:hypothetical protein